MTVIAATCCCGSVGAPVSDVRCCPDHHRYWRGDKELASVSKVIRTCWPIKRSFEDADPAVLENARERGVETDWLFSEWLAGRLRKIPAGTRQDAVDRFYALLKWWKNQPVKFGANPVPQLMVADDEIAGTMDVGCVTDMPLILDLKNVSALDPSYNVQLGAYADLYEAQYGVAPAGAALIHVTQPKDKPVSVRYVEIDLPQARADWKALRAVWAIARRYLKG